MGGSKNKSPAQKEKSQKEETDKKSGSKKGKKEKGEGESRKAEISVIVNEPQAMKFIQNSKVFTVQEIARQTGVKISAANLFLKKLLQSGEIKRIGGYSGHHVYQPLSK